MKILMTLCAVLCVHMATGVPDPMQYVAGINTLLPTYICMHVDELNILELDT